MDVVWWCLNWRELEVESLRTFTKMTVQKKKDEWNDRRHPCDLLYWLHSIVFFFVVGNFIQVRHSIENGFTFLYSFLWGVHKKSVNLSLNRHNVKTTLKFKNIVNYHDLTKQEEITNDVIFFCNICKSPLRLMA